MTPVGEKEIKRATAGRGSRPGLGYRYLGDLREVSQ